MLNKEKKVQPTSNSGNSAKPYVTGSLRFVRFANKNQIRFSQDHRFWKGIPDNVNFYPTDEFAGYITFIGDGYGIQPEHNLAGKYGNGAITIIKDDIPDLVEWCRTNFL